MQTWKLWVKRVRFQCPTGHGIGATGNTRKTSKGIEVIPWTIAMVYLQIPSGYQ